MLTGVVLFGSLLGGNVTTAHAAKKSAWPSGPSIEAPNAIVMEANTGTVLYEKKADEKCYPASITKIMTTLLALENCKKDEVVTFSKDAVYKTYGSGIWRDVGEKLTMEQCLYAVMLESANECAYAVGEHVAGGDYSKFIQMMNQKAKQLGCKNTHFNNCNGLPDHKHWTTCRDMALISQEAIKNQEFRKIIGTRKYKIPKTNKNKESLTMYNHHSMISANRTSEYLYKYCIGGKTGWTSDAGNTLVSYAEKDGMLLICVVMKESAGDQYKDTRKLFDYCFKHYKMYNVSENENRLDSGEISTTALTTQAQPYVELDKDASIILPKSAKFSDTTTKTVSDSKTQDVVGSIVYSYKGRQVGSADVKTTGVQAESYSFKNTIGSDENTGSSSVKGTNGKTSRKNHRASITGMKKVILLIAVVVIIIVCLITIRIVYVNAKRKKRRRNRR